MDDSDSPDEGFDLEGVLERIGRRELIGGAGAVVLSWLIFTDQSDIDDHLKRAENRLVELAASIDDADLVDPRQSSMIHREVTDGIETVNDELDQQSSDDQETKQRISALTAAIEYYTELGETLEVARSLLPQIADSEETVLNHRRNIGTDPATKFDTDSFKQAIARLSEAEKEPEDVTSRNRKLVPNQEGLVDSLHGQYKVYDLHITAQQTYIDTATTIEAGIRAQEQSNFDMARSKLSQAQDFLVDGIPTTKDRYRLSHVGLTLDQYEALLTLRRRGVKRLLDVCEQSTPAPQRRSAINEALDLFFEARGIVTSS